MHTTGYEIDKFIKHLKSMAMVKGCDLTLFDPTTKKKKKRTPLDLNSEVMEVEKEHPNIPTKNDSCKNYASDDLYFHELHFAMSEKKLTELHCATSEKRMKESRVTEPTELNNFDMISLTKSLDSVQNVGVSPKCEEKENINGNGESEYSYEDLLDRAYATMQLQNPGIFEDSNRDISTTPPQIVRRGKRTSFVNFADTCKMLRRTPRHLMAFLLAELNTSGSIDGTKQLLIKGRYQPSQIEELVKRYVKEYVACHSCQNCETRLRREDRIYFVQCDLCTCKYSVPNIKCGFQAVITPRKLSRTT